MSGGRVTLWALFRITTCSAIGCSIVYDFGGNGVVLILWGTVYCAVRICVKSQLIVLAWIVFLVAAVTTLYMIVAVVHS
jgi:hypothetical protein